RITTRTTKRVQFCMKSINRMSISIRALPVCFLLAAATGATAQETRWSDPATWPDNKVPAAGDTVEIARDKQVVLDVSPPALGGITINGKLSFADESDLELNTEWIMV